MSTMTMTIGCDLSAYATISLPAGTDLSEQNLKAIAAQIDEDGEWGGQDIVFVPDRNARQAPALQAGEG